VAALYYTGRKFFLDRDKQFTDRFNAAVDHLGSTDRTVRAGGVRALERIPHDSPTDRNRVLATLTGFLRQRTADGSDDDVTAALGALRNRGKPPRRLADQPLDLRGARLAGADLTGADLGGTDLHEVIGLTPEQIASARVDTRTRLPPDRNNHTERSS
jgi:uncharacterized protein YjbI with pentapeptide repeats